MSHENPADGIRCDHCNCAAAETREGRLGILSPNRGELLCSVCLWAAVDAEHLASGRFQRDASGRIVPTYAVARCVDGVIRTPRRKARR